MAESIKASCPEVEQHILLDNLMRVMLDAAHRCLANTPGASGVLVINAMMSACVCFAAEIGEDEARMEMSLRILADRVHVMFSSWRKLVGLDEGDQG